MTTMTTLELLEALKNNSEARAILSQLYGKSKNGKRDAEIAQRVWAGETQASVAQEFGLSVNRVSQIMATRKSPTAKPDRFAERNHLILDRIRSKVPRAVIAKEFGLSVIRINQIAGNAKILGAAHTLTLEEKIDNAMQKYDSFEPLTFEEEWRVFVRKYETIARQVAGDLLDGMSQYQIEQKYPSDCTGADLALTFMHYRNAYLYFVDESTNTWKKLNTKST